MSEEHAQEAKAAQQPARSSAFAPLRNRPFLLYWCANLAAFNGIQMSIVARGWLVYNLTESATSLGLVAAAFGVPMLLVSFYGGALSDRVSKRNLVLVTQAAGVIILSAIATLITVDAVRFWHLMVSAFLTGILFALALPAQQAMVVELVGSDQMLSAVALGAMGMNCCRIGSPALAGVLVKLIGISGAYWVVVASNLLSIAFNLYLPEGAKRAPGQSAGIAKDIVDGLRFVRGNTVVMILLASSMAIVLLAMPYQNLMPVFAKSVFQGGETGLGLLLSAIGVGALIGSMCAGSLGRIRRQGIVMLISGVSFGLFLVLFSMTRLLPLAIVLLAVATFGSSIFFVLANTLLLSSTPKEYVGRVMSLFMMTWGLQPVGSLPAAVLADRFGAPLAVAFGGIASTLFLLAMTLGPERTRRLL